jgi:hypothetical protein
MPHAAGEHEHGAARGELGGLADDQSEAVRVLLERVEQPGPVLLPAVGVVERARQRLEPRSGDGADLLELPLRDRVDGRPERPADDGREGVLALRRGDSAC